MDAVVVAVPPRFHLDLTLQALSAGKHVLVEKPAYLRMEDYLRVQSAREGAGRVVLVGVRTTTTSRWYASLFGPYNHLSDGGGVHHNSTVLSHAFYLAIEGGRNATTGRSVTGVAGQPIAPTSSGRSSGP